MDTSTSLRELLYAGLDQNLDHLGGLLGNNSDLVIRQLVIGQDRRKTAVLFFEGLADSTTVQQYVLGAMMQQHILEPGTPVEQVPEVLKQAILSVGEICLLQRFEQVLECILAGNAAVLFDGCVQGLHVAVQGWKERSITEPSDQAVIRGPKESFTETIRTNTAMVRRKIRDRRLRLENTKIGRVTKTDVSIMYIEGIVMKDVVEEVHKRLAQIDTDSILESGYIEEFMEDSHYSPFPTIQNTERPDAVAAALLEGRVAILIDGTPHALIVPSLFIQFLQSPEDYYQRAGFSSLVRVLRYIGLAIALLAPSMYIAITTFHQEMLPTMLLISLAAQREGVPFPAFIEALMMEITFEILREAGIRMPRAVGQAVSIVGTLVIGQAAVEAGIVSAAMVIVVAITAISSFVVPNYNMSIPVRMMRFFLMMLGASFGLFGIAIGLIALILHLCSLRSFGVPFMSPMAPLNLSEQEDAILRLPRPFQRFRPKMLSKNRIRTVRKPRSKS
ncbi:spore germination protein [Paenibacillus sp. y28]|uniref:spore germination protein n=1 Tax=Paenibacillus sp. y28 TaxID=3129110 RepID=UPI003019CCF9